ncbi:hypothetical protein Glove_51g16 [Diversispora epigaea]|uniref:Uncharacterized protein n=1 Tax=Diversispora epigaea TaxID=1348612 RepID=A0A397JK79_9GLOM|nr:hypothetical protein Glove_51g16 [Diversispora epigaea]
MCAVRVTYGGCLEQGLVTITRGRDLHPMLGEENARYCSLAWLYGISSLKMDFENIIFLKNTEYPKWSLSYIAESINYTSTKRPEIRELHQDLKFTQVSNDIDAGIGVITDNGSPNFAFKEQDIYKCFWSSNDLEPRGTGVGLLIKKDIAKHIQKPKIKLDLNEPKN